MANSGGIARRTIVMQQKKQMPVQFEVTEQTPMQRSLIMAIASKSLSKANSKATKSMINLLAATLLILLPTLCFIVFPAREVFPISRPGPEVRSMEAGLIPK